MNYNEARFKANANDGTVPWRNDPQGRPFRGDRPMREILAFGCDRHVQGGAVCPHWCGQDKCGVTLAEPESPDGVAPSPAIPSAAQWLAKVGGAAPQDWRDGWDACREIMQANAGVTEDRVQPFPPADADEALLNANPARSQKDGYRAAPAASKDHQTTLPPADADGKEDQRGAELSAGKE